MMAVRTETAPEACLNGRCTYGPIDDDQNRRLLKPRVVPHLLGSEQDGQALAAALRVPDAP